MSLVQSVVVFLFGIFIGFIIPILLGGGKK